MFDIGFWELALLAVIGLVVLGPERLPVVARTLGRWVAQARHYMSALTSELEKEVAAEDIRREVRAAREQIEAETRTTRDETRQTMDSVMRPLSEDLNRDAAEAAPQARAEPVAEPATGSAEKTTTADAPPQETAHEESAVGELAGRESAPEESAKAAPHTNTGSGSDNA